MIIAALFLLGLCLGSFVNALVWRLYKQSTINNKQRQKDFSITKGHSQCTHCGHKLAPKDLIPVISWIMLRGRCRYCQKPISTQYPAVELATATLFVASYLYWPNFQSPAFDIGSVVDFGVWLVCLTGFMALIVYDLRWMILPNKIIFPLLGLAGLNVCLQSLLNSNLQSLFSAFWGVLIGGGLFYLIFQISDGKWIGGGDVKLGFLLGLLVGGPAAAFLMLFMASSLGTLYSLPMVIKGKMTTKAKVPFGPFLILGAIIVKLFGQNIINWYSNSFLL